MFSFDKVFYSLAKLAQFSFAIICSTITVFDKAEYFFRIKYLTSPSIQGGELTSLTIFTGINL